MIPHREARRRIVYLDTQDYSRLADAISGRGHENLIPVYEQLRKFAHEGTFNFCFSYMIVSELLQLNSQDIEITRRKAVVMEELCGSHGFPIIFWLLSAEIAAAAQKRGIAPTRHLPTLEQVIFGGQWIRTELPDAEIMFEGFEEKIAAESKAIVLKELGRPPNRNERRRFAKPVSMDDARRFVATAQVYPIIAGTDLVDKFADALRRKRLPQVSEKFFRFLALPTRLVLSHSHLHSMGFLNDQISTLKAGFYGGLTKLRDDFDALQQNHGIQNRITRTEMMRVPLDEHLVRMTEKLKDHLVRYGAPAAYFGSGHFQEDVKSLPFLSLWRELLMPYLLMVTDEATTRRTLQPSDMVDFMHALYVPHCAVWRSDRYFANLVAPVAKDLGCRVVSKLVDLPKALNEILAKEAAS